MAILRRDRKVVKTDAEWRQQLSEEEYQVTRRVGTERAFSSDMCSLFETGIYSCLGCATILFDASEKYASGAGLAALHLTRDSNSPG